MLFKCNCKCNSTSDNNALNLRLMVKLCVALSNMLQLESVSVSLGYQNLILK